MTKLGLFLAVLAFGVLGLPAKSFALNYNRQFRDMKLPTQAMLEHYTWASPVLAASTVLKSAAALNNGTATTISTFTGQPDFPRNITLTPGGSEANIGAGTAVVTGTSIFGGTITENFAITAGQVSATTGTSAFKAVTSVVMPATSGPGATLYIGVGNKLGVPRCLNNAGDYVFSELGGTYESTRGTMAVKSSTIQMNTFAPNGSMDGSKNVDLFYVQNFQCLP